MCSHLPRLATLCLVGVRLHPCALAALSGHGVDYNSPSLARASTLQRLVMCGGLDKLAGLGPVAGVTRLSSLPWDACTCMERYRKRPLVHPCAKEGLKSAQEPVPCNQDGPVAACDVLDDAVLRVRLAASSGEDALGLLVYLLPASLGTSLPSAVPSSRHKLPSAAQRRRPTLSDMPHLAAFDERVRYSARELLALRTTAGSRSRLAALPRDVLRDDAVMRAPLLRL